jgi:hypothetical protein
MFNDNISTHQREEIINTRISNRNIPSQELEPMFSFYPKSTKYIQQPILDSRNTLPNKNYQVYTTQTFNPGSSAPWQGYVNAINIETELKRPRKDIYIPSSKSDLYVYPTFQLKYTSCNDKGMQKLPQDNSNYIFYNHTRNEKESKNKNQ